MLQELKQSHQSIETQKKDKEQEIQSLKESHKSQTREIKEQLKSKYVTQIQELQQSQMK